MAEAHEEMIEPIEGDAEQNVSVERTHEDIVADQKIVTSAAEHNSQDWSSVLPMKRSYPEDDIDDEMVQYKSETYYGTRRRGRPRKFPSSGITSQYIPRMHGTQPKTEVNDLEYEDVPVSSNVTIHSTGARVVSIPRMEARMQRVDTGYTRGGATIVSNYTGIAPRLSQPTTVRQMGQATHLAAQRLPTLSGAPPKENKPLKVVTLLPNSRRLGNEPPKPVVSSVRQLGATPQKTNKIPQLSIEKQAELIIRQSVKQVDHIISGQTLGEFNKIIDMLNSQITSLQEDNKRLNSMYTGLLEFKDARIKQLETHIDKLQNEIGVAVKNWHAQMILMETSDTKEESAVEQNVHHSNRTNRIAQVRTTAEGDWIIEDSSIPTDHNGEIHEEIIEEEVDEETFLRMQQEMQESGQQIILQHDGTDEEVVVTTADIPSTKHHSIS